MVEPGGLPSMGLHIGVRQKPAQHCEVTTLQSKIDLKKLSRTGMLTLPWRMPVEAEGPLRTRSFPRVGAEQGRDFFTETE